MNLRTKKSIFDKDGQALVELAIVLPLLTLLFLGVYDFSRAIQAKNIIANVSREGANMAARSSNVSQDIMNSVAFTAQPLDMNSNGMIYITKVTGKANNNGSVDPIINLKDDQVAWNGKTSPASNLGTPKADGQKAKNLGVSLNNGDIVYVVEVFYNYQSIFSVGKKILKTQLYSKAIFPQVLQ